MNVQHLGIYINDHFAGSLAAVELLNHLISAKTGVPGDQLLFGLREEIEQDRAVLRGLLQQLDFKESPIRKAVAWCSEKFARAKLFLEDPTHSKLARLELLEALALGIEGKRALWSALEIVGEQTSALQSLDFSTLKRKAKDQRQRVEAVRLDAAREALL
ncbi:MAG TPA: hypothetical protein VE641_18240 [Chthoniobacterales bacterium]|nr:hypothetical protein [Chthoniobacterales bacterium]